VIVRDDQLDARKTPHLQGAEKLLVGSLALGVGHRDTHDLPEAVGAHRRDDEDPLADHPSADPRLLVAGINEQVGVASASSLRSLHASSSASRFSRPGRRPYPLEKDVPHRAPVMSLTFLVETPSTYISMSAKTKAFSLRW
jgi:hypothetical protein